MKTVLKRNIATFVAVFRANSNYLQKQSQACPSSLPGGDLSSGSTSGSKSGLRQFDESQNLKNQEITVNSVLSKFRDLNLDENSYQVQGPCQID